MREIYWQLMTAHQSLRWDFVGCNCFFEGFIYWRGVFFPRKDIIIIAFKSIFNQKQWYMLIMLFGAKQECFFGNAVDIHSCLKKSLQHFRIDILKIAKNINVPLWSYKPRKDCFLKQDKIKGSNLLRHLYSHLDLGVNGCIHLQRLFETLHITIVRQKSCALIFKIIWFCCLAVLARAAQTARTKPIYCHCSEGTTGTTQNAMYCGNETNETRSNCHNIFPIIRNFIIWCTRK